MITLAFYRSILKDLGRVRTFPYHLMDIRFILSYPPIEPPHTAAGVSPSHQVSPASVYPPVDTSTTFERSMCDLSQAIRKKRVDGEKYTIVETFQHMTQLVWLHKRLQNIRSPATARLTKELEDIFDGLSEKDFLSPLHFSEEQESIADRSLIGLEEEGGGGGGVEGDVSYRVGSSSILTSSGSLTIPSPSSDSTQGVTHHHQHNPGESTSDDGYDQLNVAVTSAASLGQYRDMIPLQRRDRFPLATRFLASFGITESEVAPVAGRSSALMEFVCKRVLRHVSVTNEDMTLDISVESYFAAVNSQVAGVATAGFSSAQGIQGKSPHAFSQPPEPGTVRTSSLALGNVPTSQDSLAFFTELNEPDNRFMVHFRATLHNNNNNNTSSHIHMVNSYFLRLEIASGTLIEDIGYLDPDDVLAMLHERDAGSATSLVRGGVDTDSTDYASTPKEAAGESAAPFSEYTWRNSELPNDTGNSKVSDDHPNPPESNVTTPHQSSPSTNNNDRHFSLAFASDVDGPTVLKGMLYYKVVPRGQSSMEDEPIRTISFGHLLLDNGKTPK